MKLLLNLLVMVITLLPSILLSLVALVAYDQQFMSSAISISLLIFAHLTGAVCVLFLWAPDWWRIEGREESK
jgi:hypothetical protein